MFDDDQAMIRNRHVRVSGEHTVSRICAPPGYVGYDEAGQLTEAVRRRPYAVVLFDRSKRRMPTCSTSSSSFWTMDAHRRQGPHVDFKNTVVIMTSNLPSDMLRDHFRPDS